MILLWIAAGNKKKTSFICLAFTFPGCTSSPVALSYLRYCSESGSLLNDVFRNRAFLHLSGRDGTRYRGTNSLQASC